MKLEKILKKLPKVVIEEIDTLDMAKLQGLIAGSEEAISTATRERDGNEHYQAAKLACKDLSEGLKEVKTFQRAKIEYALRRIRALNGEDVGSDE